MIGSLLNNVYFKFASEQENLLVLFETSTGWYEINYSAINKINNITLQNYSLLRDYRCLLFEEQRESLKITDIRINYEISIFIALESGDFIVLLWDESNLIGDNSTHSLVLFKSQEVDDSFIENFNESEQIRLSV